MPRVSLVVVVISMCGLAVACAPSMNPGVAAHSALLPLASAPCPTDGAGAAEFGNEVDSLKLTVNAHDMSSPVKSQGPLGALKITQVPVGQNRSIGLYGLQG